MKLASFARVSHLVQERQLLLDHMDHDIKLSFDCAPWELVLDRAMVDALNPVIKPVIHAELQRRIDLVETELLELGMSIG